MCSWDVGFIERHREGTSRVKRLFLCCRWDESPWDLLCGNEKKKRLVADIYIPFAVVPRLVPVQKRITNLRGRGGAGVNWPIGNQCGGVGCR